MGRRHVQVRATANAQIIRQIAQRWRRPRRASVVGGASTGDDGGVLLGELSQPRVSTQVAGLYLLLKAGDPVISPKTRRKSALVHQIFGVLTGVLIGGQPIWLGFQQRLNQSRVLESDPEKDPKAGS